MNLTGQPPYQKALKRPSKRNDPTTLDRRYWKAVAACGCIVKGLTPCEGRITIHHCFTGAGGRKDHRLVLPLCWGHHLGPEGIDSTCTPKPYSKRTWQAKYGTEEALLERLNQILQSGKEI